MLNALRYKYIFLGYECMMLGYEWAKFWYIGNPVSTPECASSYTLQFGLLWSCTSVQRGSSPLNL